MKTSSFTDTLKRWVVNHSVYELLAEIVYDLRCRFWAAQMPKVMGVNETLAIIARSDVSVIRFGDGEMAVMQGYNIGYQQSSPELVNALSDVITTNHGKLLVCLPDVFSGMPNMISPHRDVWVRHLLVATAHWTALTNPLRTYGNSFISRPYMMGDKRDAGSSRRIFDAWKSVWRARPVVLVEGEFTRFGIGNDFLADAASVRRIVCPAEDAFSRLSDITAACSRLDQDALYLVALGPAAKPLVVSLMRSGRRAIDVGHLDVEYEWYLRAAQKKTSIPGKAVNEAGSLSVNAVDESDPYHGQIVARVR